MAFLPGIKQAMGLDIPEKAFQRLSDFIKPTIEEHRKSLDENDIRLLLNWYNIEVGAFKDANVLK